MSSRKDTTGRSRKAGKEIHGVDRAVLLMWVFKGFELTSHYVTSDAPALDVEILAVNHLASVQSPRTIEHVFSFLANLQLALHILIQLFSYYLRGRDRVVGPGICVTLCTCLSFEFFPIVHDFTKNSPYLQLPAVFSLCLRVR